MQHAVLAAFFGLAHGLPAANHDSSSSFEQHNLLRRVGRLLALGNNLPPMEANLMDAGSGCVSISTSGDAVVSDTWCQTSCPTGICPETLCKCEATASAAVAISFRAIAEAPAKVCKSVNPSANDYWCTLHCAKRDCSEKMCSCEHAPKMPEVMPMLTAKDGECPGYTSLPDLHDESMSDWCQNSCPLFCPEDKCICTTDLPEPEVVAPGAAAITDTRADGVVPKAAKPEKPIDLSTALPRTIPSTISGPWFYVADGLDKEATGRERNPLYGDFENGAAIGHGNLTGRKLPDWLASSSLSGNAVTLAFMNPTELGSPEFGVPASFIEYTHLLRQGAENRDRQIYFAIGGLEFNGYDFLSNNELAEKAGASACEAARAHNVGIEIDHEGTKGNDVEGLRSFLKGFRKKCAMGKYPVSMDVMGGPGGGGLFWAPEAVKELVPSGRPSDPPPDDGGYYLDFVNIMVIGACQSGECLTGFWQQWEDAGLNYERAAFTFAADAICDEPDSDMIRDAWVWAKERKGYGLRAWSVNPHLGGGEWKTECNENGAPGLQAMCAAAGAGCKAPKA